MKKQLFVIIIIIFYPAKPNGVGDIVTNGRTRYFHNDMFSRRRSLVFRFTSNTRIAYLLSLPPQEMRSFRLCFYAKTYQNTHAHVLDSQTYKIIDETAPSYVNSVAYAPLIVRRYTRGNFFDLRPTLHYMSATFRFTNICA